jgi:hypothetical protein
VSRSARRHKIGKAHMMVALSTEPTLIDDEAGPRLEWIAPDDRGIVLHIRGFVAAEDDDLVIVYHCQPVSYESVPRPEENEENNE